MTHHLLRRAQTTGTPLIDGLHVTFVWSGEQPPHLVGDFNAWEPAGAQQWVQTAPGLWASHLECPADAYMEYVFLTDVKEESRLTDPFNQRVTPNGLGFVNNYFYMPGCGPSPLAERRPGSPQGRMSRHRIDNDWLLANGKRRIHLYSPPSGAAVPLLVVYDGEDYLKRGRITHIVDNLIAQGRIRPIAIALVENAGTARGVEYSCSESTVGFLMGEVLPCASRLLHLVDPAGQPGAFAVLGASMGGLMALYTGLRQPSVFGHVLSQSGAFELGGGEMVTSVLVRHMPRQPLKIWMDVGRYEWLLEPNRRMHASLAERGYDPIYREHNGGHNYPSWRDDLSHGLEAVFGPRPPAS